MTKTVALGSDLYAFEEEGRGPSVRSFLLIGREKALQIDSGVGGTDFLSELPQLTKLPVALVNTHGDRDHIARNDQFQEKYIHLKDLPAVLSLQKGGVYRPIAEGDRFALGGTMLTALACPGHTAGSIALFDGEKGRLFIGDTLSYGDLWLFGPGRDHRAFLQTLDRLLLLGDRVKVFYPCHGPCPADGFLPLLRDTRTAVENFLNGQPPSDILHIERGPLNKYLQRYKAGCASVLCREVPAP